MNSIGFFSLGASAGIISGLIMSRARTPANIGSSLVALLPVLLSGALVFLNPQLAGASSVDFYAIGLLASLMWQKTTAAISVLNQLPWLQYSLAAFGFFITIILIATAIFLSYRST